ncbi:MAG TPA: hypothetical protein VLA12_00885 [Planctomycetaceae bacterium]|nr:hypothetical protein [Planctomycetaceae bacterium]
MRGIAIIAGFQIAVVVIGWCTLGIVLKFNGYPEGDPFIRWTPLAVWLREYGVWFLLISPIWTGIATVLMQKQDRDGLNAVMFAVGAVFAIAILAVFLAATFNPYTRPMLWT